MYSTLQLKMKLKFLLVLALVLGLGSGSVVTTKVTVSAQEIEPEIRAVPQSPEVPKTEPQGNTIAQTLTTLKETYRGQLAEYRDAERSYQIASQQYLQLNTLVSLESAVQGMKKTMVLRDQVLITYVTILQTQLSISTGINLDQKTTLSTSLEAQLLGLKAHLVTAQAAETKEQVVQVTQTFKVLGDTTEEVAYQVQTIVATGKLQTIYDKSITLANEIDQNLVAGTADIKQRERQRAIAEVRLALGRSKEGINYLLENRSSNASQSSFQTALRELNQVYGDVSQALDYLDELMRL